MFALKPHDEPDLKKLEEKRADSERVWKQVFELLNDGVVRYSWNKSEDAKLADEGENL